MIILPLIPDPADIVVQGEQTVFYTPSASILSPVLQGQVIGDKVLGNSVPCAMIGLSELYGVPSEVGPKVVSGGELVMINIIPKPVNMLVDPTQTWLYSKVKQDATGALQDITGDLLMSMTEPDFYDCRQLIGDTDNSLLGMPTTVIPREEITRSGSAKRWTVSNPPVSFGAHQMLNAYVETTRKWFVTGVTRNSASVALGTCRVVILQSGKIAINADALANPVVADVVSDGSGNYSVQVNNNGQFQIIAYKAGNPDIGGVTLNTVIPADG